MAMHLWGTLRTCQALGLAVALMLLHSFHAAHAYSHPARSGNRKRYSLTSSSQILSTVQGSAELQDPWAYVRSGWSGLKARNRVFLAALNLTTDGDDLESLLKFKSSLVNGNEVLSGWKSSGDQVCEWIGVTCSHGRKGRVTELNLPSLGLQGQISPALGSLQFLVQLNLSTNSLYGPLPLSLGNLSHLESMSFFSNNITGSIPPELGRLSALRVLDLHNNDLSGRIPLSISNCSYLTSVEFSQNSLEGFIPPELGLLKNLKGLRLSENMLTGPIPVSIMTNCTNLKILYAWGNQLQTGGIPKELGF